jgi:hypothetical protein
MIQVRKIFLSLRKYFKENYLLVIILITSAFFRFYNAFNRYTLGYESIRDANVAVVGASTLHLPLTGPFSSLGAFTFGPWYWYHLILFQLILPISQSPWIILGIFSILFIFFLYKIGELLGNKQLGFTIGFLAAVSRYLVSWSTTLTNPGFVFIYSGLSLWFFLKLVKKDLSYWWSFALGISIGIGINIHYQMLPYFLLIALLLIIKYKKPFYFVSSCIGAFVTFIPLIIFDIINKGYMIKAIFQSYFAMNNTIYVPNSWKIYLLDFWPKTISDTLGVPLNFGILLTVVISGTMGFLIIKRQLTKELLLICFIFFLFLIHLRYYSGERVMGYVHYLMPFIFIFTGYAIWKLLSFKYGRYLYYLVMMIMLIIVLPSNLQQIKTDHNSSRLTQLKYSITQKFPDKKFRLYHCNQNDPGSIMSLLYLLHFDNKLSNDGIRLALDDASCVDKFSRGARKTLEKVKLNNNEIVVDLKNIPEDNLIKSGLEPYSMESRYNETAFWWVGKNL